MVKSAVKVNNNKSEKFFELQFNALRTEISERQKRRFQIITGSLFGIPGVGSLAQKFDFGILIFALPVLIIVSVLMYVSENNGIMRIGKFVRKNLEPQANETPGWEAWLEIDNGDDRRSVDKMVNYAFFSLIFFYFCFSIYFALIFETQFINEVVKNFLIMFYIGFASVVGLAMFLKAKDSSR